MGADKCPPQGNKPNLRGFHIKQTMRHVYISLGLSAISGALYYFLINEPHKAVYQEFYANYDANASFVRMREAGLLSSCPPEPKEEEKKRQSCLRSLVYK